MIIDLHTHAWSDLRQLGPDASERLRIAAGDDASRLDASPAAHDRAMACVDAAFVVGLRADRAGVAIPAEYVAAQVARHPRHLAGVAGIDPLAPDPVGEVDRAMDLGLVAVAISPASAGFHPAHSDAMRVYERCAELKVPVFVIEPSPLPAQAILDFVRPAHLDEVARALPELKLVVGRLGHPWTEECLVLLAKHHNVHAEISGVVSRPWTLYQALMGARSAGVMNKLFLGSGFPETTPARAIESLYTVNAFSHGTQLPAVPRALVRGIVERDVVGCLGLDVVLSPRERDGNAGDEAMAVRGGAERSGDA